MMSLQRNCQGASPTPPSTVSEDSNQDEDNNASGWESLQEVSSANTSATAILDRLSPDLLAWDINQIPFKKCIFGLIDKEVEV